MYTIVFAQVSSLLSIYSNAKSRHCYCYFVNDKECYKKFIMYTHISVFILSHGTI